ncbi:MAG: hypothetical protein L6R39_001014 [Caloplaca ligustica]|nr:MAG: hypothetical protein L6R39_001014 [Caloplaca ligustica]
MSLGYEKVQQCCALARKERHSYVWIDTCCIDKKSSAELSEAINSMYAWYGDSETCYVYLSDFSVGTSLDQITNSRWFRRGWTLQELLAPHDMIFYDQGWNYIGNKYRLRAQLSVATGIKEDYLLGELKVSGASVATRMSWASNRRTTRPEDEAYCLMGIFGVNMPLLYGEGNKAFLRLQHEIARNMDDESLFAWHTDDLESGIFAPDPHAFAGSYQFRSQIVHGQAPREVSTITNQGLRVQASYTKFQIESLHGSDGLWMNHSSEYYLLPLNCVRKGNETRPFTIILRKLSRNQFVRYLPCEIMVFEKYFPLDLWERRLNCKEYQECTIYIRDPVVVNPLDGRPICVVKLDPSSLNHCLVREWYLSPPATLAEDSNGSWSVYFSGWSGFAVFKVDDGASLPLIIVLKDTHSPEGERSVILHSAERADHDTFEVGDAIYAERDYLQPVSKPPAEQWVWDKLHASVSLVQGPPEVLYLDRNHLNYVLRIHAADDPEDIIDSPLRDRTDYPDTVSHGMALDLKPVTALTNPGEEVDEPDIDEQKPRRRRLAGLNSGIHRKLRDGPD